MRWQSFELGRVFLERFGALISVQPISREMFLASVNDNK